MDSNSEGSRSPLLSSKPLVKTNEVLLQFPSENSSKFSFHLPCYIRLEILNFISVSVQDLKGTINVKLMFDVDLTGLPEKLKQFLKYNISLRFNEDPLIVLDKSNPEITMKTRMMDDHQIVGYRIRKQMTAKIVPKIRFTPYELLYLISTVAVGHIEIDNEGDQGKSLVEEFNEFLQLNKLVRNGKEKKFNIRFNIMDYKRQQYEYYNEEKHQNQKMMARIIYSYDCSFGNYDLAQRMLKVQYTNVDQALKIRQEEDYHNEKSIFHRLYDRIKHRKLTKQQMEQKQKLFKQYSQRRDSKIQPFNSAHFEIPIFRKPIVSLMTIFIPLWLLGFLNLGIFFQQNDLGARIGSIATIMLSYVAFIPSIREQIPPTPKITYVQIMVYLQIFITLLCFLQSLINRHQGYQFNYATNSFFLLSAVIQGIQTVIILTSYFIYYFFYLPSYNVRRGLLLYFKREDWENQKCDKYYDEKMKDFKYTIVNLADLTSR